MCNIHHLGSFVQILNLSYVIEQIINRNDIPSGVYLLSDNETLSTSNVISELSLKKLKGCYFSNFSAFLFKRLLSFDKLLGNTAFFRSLRTLTSDYVISNSKITKTLGESLPFKSKDGIRSIKDK